MGFKALLNPEIQSFMAQHKDADVKALALKKMPHLDWPAALILGQIKTRQKAQNKTPEFAQNPNYIFPPLDLYEQVSSEACARFKASLFKGNYFVDLSAGGGVDGYYIAQNFKDAKLVEVNSEAHKILTHNMSVLKNAAHIEVIHADACDYMERSESIDLAFIDPQRRSAGRKGLYDLSECSPNVLELLPALKEKTKKLCIKTSPVLDIEKACRQLGYVQDVYVIEYQGDCKEVLYVLNFDAPCEYPDVQIHALQINERGGVERAFNFTPKQEKLAESHYTKPMRYIYEPCAAVMKSGGFHMLSQSYGLSKIQQHSHIYTSHELVSEFPGKVYEFVDVVAVKAKALTIKKADLVLRNFPGDVNILKKKLKIRDGGEHRLFATTLHTGEKALIISRKLLFSH